MSTTSANNGPRSYWEAEAARLKAESEAAKVSYEKTREQYEQGLCDYAELQARLDDWAERMDAREAFLTGAL